MNFAPAHEKSLTDVNHPSGISGMNIETQAPRSLSSPELFTRRSKISVSIDDSPKADEQKNPSPDAESIVPRFEQQLPPI